MAEPIKKTYISAREFVDSWEKEIYELSNLDYFIYLLINELALGIEKNFFSRLNPSDSLYLESDEIGTLSFNLSDSIQVFLENNCFGGCSLNCPVKLNEGVGKDFFRFRFLDREEKNIKPGFCRVRGELLYFDLLNYVVSDALIDFYNFEMETDINMLDKGLVELTELIMKIIMDFVKKNGIKYLSEPRESCGYLFDELLKTDTGSWDEHYEYEEQVNEQEGEEWKEADSAPATVFHTFRETLRDSQRADLKMLERFEEFIIHFLDIDRIEQLSGDDVEEFFSIIAVNEMMLEDMADFGGMIRLFDQFFAFLEFHYKMNVSMNFSRFCRKRIPSIERTFQITRSYKEEHPLVQYLLSELKDDKTLTDGFFEIENINGGFLYLQDIHLKSVFKKVHPGGLSEAAIKKGDILHAQIIRNNTGWRIVHLEMIYPASARDYLY